MEDGSKQYLLGICGGITDSLGISDELYDAVTIAEFTQGWAATLRTIGYPDQSFISQLQTVEAAFFKRSAKKPLLEYGDFPEFAERQVGKVIKSVASWRINHNPKLPKVVIGDGCGAGGPVPVNLQSKPPGAKIYIISEFEYDLCKALGQKNDDPLTCKSWRLAKDKEEVSGWAYVQAEGKYGKLPPTRMSFEDVTPGQIIPIPLK